MKNGVTRLLTADEFREQGTQFPEVSLLPPPRINMELGHHYWARRIHTSMATFESGENSTSS
jgi:hypothetical protein